MWVYTVLNFPVYEKILKNKTINIKNKTVIKNDQKTFNKNKKDNAMKCGCGQNDCIFLILKMNENLHLMSNRYEYCYNLSYNIQLLQLKFRDCAKNTLVVIYHMFDNSFCSVLRIFIEPELLFFQSSITVTRIVILFFKFIFRFLKMSKDI